MKPVFEFEDDGKFIELGIFVLRSVCDQFFYLAELESHHVEKVDRRLVQEPAGDIHIAGPDRIHKLAAVHLYMSRVRFVALKQMLELNIDGCVATIVSDLKDASGFVRSVAELSSVRYADRERLLAEDVLLFRDRMQSDLFVCFVRCADENCIAALEQLLARGANLAADRFSRRLGAFRYDVIKSRDLGSRIARVDPAVDIPDITRANNSDLNFIQYLTVQSAGLSP